MQLCIEATPRLKGVITRDKWDYKVANVARYVEGATPLNIVHALIRITRSDNYGDLCPVI